jgi:hypothetical protein
MQVTYKIHPKTGTADDSRDMCKLNLCVVLAMMAETSNLNLNGGRGIKSAYAVDKVNGQCHK